MKPPNVSLARTVCCLLVAIRLLAVAPTIAFAASPEYKVKAAYIYHFCRYVDWPTTAFERNNDPLVVAVLGRDPFGSSLDALAKKSVNGRRIVVRRFATAADVRSCHVLFIAGPQDQDLHPWAIRHLRNSPTLLIGETEDFAARGADVNFFLDDKGTVGFRINVESVQRKHLKISSRLARLAEIVHTKK